MAVSTASGALGGAETGAASMALRDGRHTLSVHDSGCGSDDGAMTACSALGGGQGSSDTARDLASSFFAGGALLEGEGGGRFGLSSW